MPDVETPNRIETQKDDGLIGRTLRRLGQKFNDDQPRDEAGRFSSDGGSGGGADDFGDHYTARGGIEGGGPGGGGDLYHARFELGRFQIDGYGKSEREARTAVERTTSQHVRQTGAERENLRYSREDTNVTKVNTPPSYKAGDPVYVVEYRDADSEHPVTGYGVTAAEAVTNYRDGVEKYIERGGYGPGDAEIVRRNAELDDVDESYASQVSPKAGYRDGNEVVRSSRKERTVAEIRAARAERAKGSEDQPRDDHGRFANTDDAGNYDVTRHRPGGHPERTEPWMKPDKKPNDPRKMPGFFETQDELEAARRAWEPEAFKPSKKKEATVDDQGAFAAFKDTDGAWRFMTTWSNHFTDRDGEVFPEAAHKEFIEHVETTGKYPELWMWHQPGSRVGKADFIAYDNGFCVASGTFDAGCEDVAQALSRDKAIGVSHGYSYDLKDVRGGVYSRYRTFEISPLPAARAANEGTAFAALKEVPMLTAEKKKWLEEKIGPERTATIEQNHRRMRKELEDRGISYKEFVDALAETAETDITVAADPPKDQPKGDVTDDADGEKAGADNFGGKKAPPFKADNDGGDGGDKDDEDAKKKRLDALNAMKSAIDTGVKEGLATGLKETVASAVKEAMTPIEQRLADQDMKLEALKASDDEKISAAWKESSRTAYAAKSASDADDNVVDGDKAKKVVQAGGEDLDPAAATPYVSDLMRSLGLAPAGQ